MATYRGFELAKGPDNIQGFPEADNEEFYIGAPVGLSSGEVVALADTAEDSILGIAMEDSANDTNNAYISVSVISEEQEWRAHLDPDATNSAPEDITIGAGYKLHLDTNEWFVDGDTAATSNDGFVILRHEKRGDDTDGGAVIGKFAENAYLGNKG